MADEYPKRPNHFAHKYTRLLFEVCAAAEIGLDGVALCVHVAHLEDKLHYRGPIRLWNTHLENALSASEDKLRRIRQKCVSGRWLHYERETNRSIGRYWVTIPDEVEGVPEIGFDPQVNHRKSAGNGPVNHRKSAGNSAGIPAGNNAGTSCPVPNPIPNKDSAHRKKKRKNGEPRDYSEGFLAFWAEYPRKAAKPTAADAFASAVHRLIADAGHEDITTEAEAAEFLARQAKAFSRQVADTEDRFVAHATTWLNQDRFEDCAGKSTSEASPAKSGLYDADRLRNIFSQAVKSRIVDQSKHSIRLYCVAVAETRQRNGRLDDVLCGVTSLASLDRAGQERRIEQHHADAAAVYDLLRGGHQ